MNFTKYFLFPILFSMIAMCCLSGCKDDKSDPDNPIEEEDYLYTGGDHGVTYNYTAYIAPTITGELRAALDKCIPFQSSSIDDITSLIIVKQLSDLPAATLEEAYQEGCTIAMVDPTHTGLQSWFDTHPDWNVLYSETTLGEDAAIYFFDRNNEQGVVKRTPLSVDMDSSTDPEDEYDGEDELDFSGDEPNGQYYAVLGLWLDHMNQLKGGVRSAITRSDNPALPRIEDLTSSYRFHHYFPIQLDKVIRKGIGIKGNGGISITIEVNPIHVYEKTTGKVAAVGNGDYYLISMSASVANSNMYIGKIKKTKVGVVYRLIGYLCNDFSVQASLRERSGSKVANLVIPPSSGPYPTTTVGQTSYESSQKYSMDISGGWSMEDGPNAGVKFGAEWSSSQSRTISDIGILNTTQDNDPSWTVCFENLPKYSDGKIAFVEQKGVYAFRATQYLFGQWVWQVKGTRDDRELPNKCIFINGNARYQAQSFYSTKADLKTKEFIIPYTCRFEVPDPYKRTKGHIVLHNDMGGYIRNIEVVDMNTSEIIYTLKDSYPSGSEIDLGWYPVYKAGSHTDQGRYSVRFTMNGDTYIYENLWILMEDRITRNLYGSENFRKF